VLTKVLFVIALVTDFPLIRVTNTTENVMQVASYIILAHRAVFNAKFLSLYSDSMYLPQYFASVNIRFCAILHIIISY
jgi:hypothetical protein